MAQSRMLGWIGQGIAGTAFVAVLAGLPIAVAMRAPADQTASVMSRPRDAIIIATPKRLTSVLALTIDAGVLHGPKPDSWQQSSQLGRVEAEGVGLTLDFSQTSRGSDVAPAAPTELDRALSHLANLNFAILVVRRSHLDVLRADGTPVRLTDVNAEVRATRKEAFAAKGTARYRGSLLSFEAEWSRPSDPKAAAIYPLKLKIDGRALRARIDGNLDLTGVPKIEGKGDFRSPKLRVLARWLGLPVLPGEDLRLGSIIGDLVWTSGALTFANATISVDGNEGAGALSLSTSGSRPKLDGTLAFKTFAINRYLEGAMGELPTPSATMGGPKQKSILSLIDADLRLSAAKIQAPRLELGRAAITLSLKNGRMLADIAEVEVEGGSASGQLTLDALADDLRLGLKLRGRQVDPGRALTDVMKRNPLLGRVNIALEGSGSGTSIPDIMRKLTGRGSMELVDGGRLGLDLKALAHVAQTQQASGWAVAGRGNTPLSSLEARFQIVSGTVRLETVTAKSGGASILGTGSIDMINRLIDVSIAMGTGSATEVPVSNRDVLRLHGPWAEPLIGVHVAPAPVIMTAPAHKGANLKNFIEEFKASSPVSVEAGQYGAFQPR